MGSSEFVAIALFKKSSDSKWERWERPMVTFIIGVEHNDVANSGITHFPQVKSICINVIELGLLLLNRILHIIPNLVISNSDCKYLFGQLPSRAA
jgi:hypothetical protein